MKTAYELAMERLKQDSPTVKLTKAQKKEMAELDSQYAAKIAAREIHLKGQMAQAAGQGDAMAMESLQQQLASEKADLNRELDEKKNKVREKGNS